MLVKVFASYRRRSLSDDGLCLGPPGPHRCRFLIASDII